METLVQGGTAVAGPEAPADPEFPQPAAGDPVVGPSKPRLLGILGPGLITGASDDDPSGIATYSQAGAQIGFGVLWLMPFTYPLMAVTQEISARIGRTTGRGLAGNIRRQFPSWVGLSCIALLLIANIINLGADLGSMGDVAHMLIGGPRWLVVVAFGLTCIGLQVLLQYTRYVAVLKWLTLALFAYFGTALAVRIPWAQALRGLVVPSWHNSSSFIAIVVAVLGTTISPYLYFWQASQEAEDQHQRPRRERLAVAPEQAPAAFGRIRLDTWIGMALSNLVALAILMTAAATLHASGKTDIATSQQAAEALRPVAGAFASLVFAIGIIGTGFMAVPILAGSAAYAVGEVLRWPVGLARKPKAARAFYATLAVATVIGTVINFLPIDPIRALYWSAVINGVMAAPIIVVMMLLASNPRVMGEFTLSASLRAFGWLTAAVMALCAVGLFVTMFI
jgi:NRAMP (natural resistance-associated macrophage protein)-like metal ion transporter